MITVVAWTGKPSKDIMQICHSAGAVGHNLLGYLTSQSNDYDIDWSWCKTIISG